MLTDAPLSSRQHCAGIKKIRKNGSLNVSDKGTTIPMRDEHRGSRPSIILATSQGYAHRTLVDEYDFVFVEMLVCRYAVSGRHLLCANHKGVRSCAHRFDFEDQRLVSKQHPTITFIG